MGRSNLLFFVEKSILIIIFYIIDSIKNVSINNIGTPCISISSSLNLADGFLYSIYCASNDPSAHFRVSEFYIFSFTAEHL